MTAAMTSGITTTIAMSAPDTAMITVLTMMANWSGTVRIARTDQAGGTSSDGMYSLHREKKGAGVIPDALCHAFNA